MKGSGAELLILSGDSDGDPTGHYPDDVFVGEAADNAVVPASAPQLSMLPATPLTGVMLWVKKNPVIAGGIAIAAVYIIIRMTKKRRRR